MKPVIIVDTREPWPHPWQRWIGEHCELVRGWNHAELKKPATQPTGDFCAESAFSYDVASGEVEFKPRRLVERKTLADFYGCCTASRERFSAELLRMLDLKLLHGTRSAIVVEATWPEAVDYASKEHGMDVEAFKGTVTAWERRFADIVWLKNEKAAAWWSMMYLTGVMD